MNPRAKRLAGALSGAVLLTSGAYALGTQTEDGSAVAGSASNTRAHDGFGANRMAKRLGVDVDELEGALEEIRKEEGRPAGDPRQRFAADLAEELGVTKGKVEAALERLRKKQTADFEARHDAFEKALADKLGVSVERVRKAFPAPPAGGPPGGRLGPPPGHPGDHGGPPRP